MVHELPSLINDKDAALLISTNNIPNVRKHDIHSDWPELVLKVADVEDDHLIIDVNVGLLREDTGKSTSGVFLETLGENWATASHMEEGVVEI